MLRRRKFFDYVVLKILIYEFVDNLFELIFDGRSFEVVFKVFEYIKEYGCFYFDDYKELFFEKID